MEEQKDYGKTWRIVGRKHSEKAWIIVREQENWEGTEKCEKLQRTEEEREHCRKV